MAIASHQRRLVRLRDGSEVLIRRLTPADAPLLADGFARLSEESRRLRFLTPKASLTPSELRYLTKVDGHWHEALGAIDPESGRCVAVGRFIRELGDPQRAEVAITVADEWQRRGLGKLLLGRLVDRARDEGIERFTALVAGDNRGMQKLFEQGESPAHVACFSEGIAAYEIELAPKGIGTQLADALRGAAAGHLHVPPRLREILQTLVPLNLHRQ